MNDRIEAIRAELEKALEDLGKVRDRLEEIVARAWPPLSRPGFRLPLCSPAQKSLLGLFR